MSTRRLHAAAPALALLLAAASCGGDADAAGPTCTDGLRNGAETDVDCGGTCPDCVDGAACAAGADCVSGFCSGLVCYAASCGNGAKDGAETDVDCGGGTCPACADSHSCILPGDCVSGFCGQSVCLPAHCGNGLRDADEADVDCGGAACPACPQTCAIGDCGECAFSTCAVDACLDEQYACDGSPDCVDFNGCYAGCMTVECVSACETSYPAGASLWYQLADCRYCSPDTCATDCAVFCPITPVN